MAAAVIRKTPYCCIDRAIYCVHTAPETAAMQENKADTGATQDRKPFPPRDDRSGKSRRGGRGGKGGRKRRRTEKPRKAAVKPADVQFSEDFIAYYKVIVRAVANPSES